MFLLQLHLLVVFRGLYCSDAGKSLNKAARSVFQMCVCAECLRLISVSCPGTAHGVWLLCRQIEISVKFRHQIKTNKLQRHPPVVSGSQSALSYYQPPPPPPPHTPPCLPGCDSEGMREATDCGGRLCTDFNSDRSITPPAVSLDTPHWLPPPPNVPTHYHHPYRISAHPAATNLSMVAVSFYKLAWPLT